MKDWNDYPTDQEYWEKEMPDNIQFKAIPLQLR